MNKHQIFYSTIKILPVELTRTHNKCEFQSKRKAIKDILEG